MAIARTTFGGGTGGATHSPPPRPSPRRHAAAAVAWLPGSVSVVISGGIRAPTVTRGSGQGGGNETAGSALVFGDVWQLEFVGARAAWQKLDVSGGDSAGGGLPRYVCTIGRRRTRFVCDDLSQGRGKLPRNCMLATHAYGREAEYFWHEKNILTDGAGRGGAGGSRRLMV